MGSHVRQIQGDKNILKTPVLAGTTVDLTDIISGTPVEDQSSPLARRADAGLIEARDSTDIIDDDSGLLTWRD